MKLVITFVLLLLASIAYSADPTILAGKWKFNAKDSDDPKQKFQEAMKNRNGGFGPSGPETSNRPGVFSGHQSSRDRDRDRTSLLQPPDWIDISYTSPQVRVIDNRGEERDFYTDGRKTEKEMKDNRKIAWWAEWQDDSLAVTTQAKDGGKVYETYYLSPDQQHLYVKFKVQPLMMDQPVTILRVFDKMPTESAPAQTQNAHP
ncbi:MAG: hypothetical protein C5B54_11275 [Acidobacteria bacterium]|nr:MAG: hypothetical protein C5B54_11275 [Acidobacteriota bacterium]